MSSAVASWDVERVYAYLCRYWEDFHQAPPQDAIMHDLNLPRRHVIQALEHLEDSGRLHPGTGVPVTGNGTDAGIPF